MNPELAPFEALAKETLRRIMAEEEPADIRQWMLDALSHLGGGDNNAVMTWEQSFDLTDAMRREYEERANIPEKDRKDLSWPWSSWNERIDQPEEGILGVIAAPDGAGKTIYVEMIAEHWASKKNRVVFVHYELNRRLMMQRRMARHARITAREFKAGKYTPAQIAKMDEVRPRLTSWDGLITYLHTPGWSMERTTAELTKLRAEGLCDVVVVDYLEKVAASRRQLQMFGSQQYQREADNVEQLKNFAESTGIPVIMVTQMNKEGKKTGFENVDRTAIRGAGEKSEKANLVVLIERKRTNEGYSNEVSVLIDKNTMGKTDTFTQIMVPEFFTVGDPQRS